MHGSRSCGTDDCKGDQLYDLEILERRMTSSAADFNKMNADEYRCHLNDGYNPKSRNDGSIVQPILSVSECIELLRNLRSRT